MMMKSVFWWRNPEYPEETTDLRQVTDETFHTYGLCPVRGLNLWRALSRSCTYLERGVVLCSWWMLPIAAHAAIASTQQLAGKCMRGSRCLPPPPPPADGPSDLPVLCIRSLKSCYFEFSHRVSWSLLQIWSGLARC